MKHRSLLLICLGLVVAISATTVILDSSEVYSESICTSQSGLWQFTYTVEGDEATITGISMIGDQGGSLIIPSSISDAEKTYSVVKVGPSAALNVSTITDITIPSTVKEIGKEAFKPSNTATNKAITINVSNNKGTLNISGTSNTLQSVTIQSDSLILGEGAFALNSGLTTFTSGKVKEIPKNCFIACGFQSYDLTGVTKIGDNAFLCCTSLSQITIPNTVTNIGTEAFACSEMSKNTTTKPNSSNFKFYSSTTKVYDSISPYGSLTDVTFESGEGEITIANNAQVFLGQDVKNVVLDRIKKVPKYFLVGFVDNLEIKAGVKQIDGNSIFNVKNPVPISKSTNLNMNTFYKGTNSDCLISSNSVKLLIDEYDDKYIKTKYNGATLLATRDLELYEFVKIQAGGKNSIQWVDGYDPDPQIITHIEQDGKLHLTGLYKITQFENELVIPKEIQVIDKNVYKEKTGFTVLRFEEGSILEEISEGAFQLTSVKEVQGWPDTLKKIGMMAFQGSSLVNLDLSSSIILEEIGEMAFQKCNSLKTIRMPSSSVKIAGGVFSSCVSLNTVDLGSTNSLGYNAFSTTGLTEVLIPATVQSIGHNAFQSCENLKTVIFEEGSHLLEIPAQAFIKCVKLSSINIPDSVTTISQEAFKSCKSLETLRIPAATTDIHVGDIGSSHPFVYCEKLALEIDAGNQTFINSNGLIITKDGSKVLFLMPVTESVVIPETVTEFTSTDGITKVFSNNTHLVSVDFSHSNITAITDSMFENCSELVEVRLNNKIVDIGSSAFAGTRLSSIISSSTSTSFPDTLRNIGSDAFSGTALESALVFNTGLLSIGSNAFKGTAITSVTLPSSVETISSDAFSSCVFLEQFIVADDGRFSVMDDALVETETDDQGQRQNLLIVPMTKTKFQLSGDVDATKYQPFKECFKLKEIVVTGSTMYTSGNETDGTAGMLLSSDGSTLVYVPASIGVVNIVCDRDLTVGSGAFNNIHAKEIAIHAKSVVLNYHAITECDNIQTIMVSGESISMAQFSITNMLSLSLIVLMSNQITLPTTAFELSVPSCKFFIGSDEGSAVSVEPNFIAKLRSDAVYDIVISGNITGTGAQYWGMNYRLFLTQKTEIDFGNASIYSSGWDPEGLSIKGYFYADWKSTDIIEAEIIENIPVFIDSEIDIQSVTGSLENGQLSLQIISKDGRSYGDMSVYYKKGRQSEYISATYEGGYILSITDSSPIFIKVTEYSSQETVAISFDTNYEALIDPITIPKGGSLYSSIMPIMPSRNMYTFEGWYIDEGLATIYESGTPINTDTTLHAKWKQNAGPRITFESKCGNVSASQSGVPVASGTILVNNRAVSLEYSDVDSFDFIGWSCNGVLVSSTSKKITVTIEEDSHYEALVRYYTPSNYLDGLVDVETITSESADPVLIWRLAPEVDRSMGIWTGFPSTPLVVGDYVYVRQAYSILKIDSNNGLILARASVSTQAGDYYHSLCYGDGLIIDQINKTVFDLDLNKLYELDKLYGSIYYDSGSYYGVWGSHLYKMTMDESTYTIEGGSWDGGVDVNWLKVYGTYASPVFTKDHIYFIESSGPDRFISSVNIITAEKQTLELESIQNHMLDDGWLTFDNGVLYLTSYTQGLFGARTASGNGCITKIVLNDDGSMCEPVYKRTESSSIHSGLVVYNGRGYLQASDTFYVYNAATLDIIYSEPSVFTHGGIVVNTKYATAENNYKVYIYHLAYLVDKQGIYIHEDDSNKTSGGMYKFFSAGEGNYGSQGIRFCENGNLIWYTDTGRLFCYGTEDLNKYYFLVGDKESAQWITSIGSDHRSAFINALNKMGVDCSISKERDLQSIGGKAEGTNGNAWYVSCFDGETWFGGMMNDEEFSTYHYFQIFYGTAKEYDEGGFFSKGTNWAYIDGESGFDAYVLSIDTVDNMINRTISSIGLTFCDTDVSEREIVSTVVVKSILEGEVRIKLYTEYDLSLFMSDEIYPVKITDGSVTKTIHQCGITTPVGLFVYVTDLSGQNLLAQKYLSLTGDIPLVF